jgi:hypothetical protein
MKLNYTEELIFMSRIFKSRSFKMISFNFILFIIAFCGIITAQPSGGPYGPVQQNYDLPKVKGKIYYVAPDGNTGNSGESISNPTTLETAIAKVKTGDAIILRGGIYRTGNLVLNQGITMQPYKDERPVLKGTYVAKDWKDIGNGLWMTTWDHLFPMKPQSWWLRNKEGKYTPLHRFNNDMVFVDGRFLQSAGWEGEVDSNTYYIDYDSKTVYIGVNPADRLIEITAFDIALLRTIKDVHGKKNDHKGPIIKGITFTQYAYRAIEIEGTEPEGLSPEAEHGKEVIGTTLENCTISFCSRVAGYFRGNHLTIRHCKISDTSTEGIYIIASNDVLLEKNIFTRNNIEKITGYYPAAVKILNQCYHATCRDNLIIDLPYSNGVWYDVGEVDGRFINNWVENVGNNHEPINVNQPWPSQNGFFFEISKGAICAGNVFVNCDHGSWALNSSNVHFYNNTYVNSMAVIGRNGRTAANDHFGWHPSTGPDIHNRDGHIFTNNLLTADENFTRPLLFVWQPSSICDTITNPELKELNNNVYVRMSNDTSHPLIYYSPAKNENCIVTLDSPEALHKLHPEFSGNSRYFAGYNGPLFKSRELKNYNLLTSFPGAKSYASIPQEVLKLLGESKSYLGAYPPIQ